ncbi:ricin B lectin domain-containing protein [Trichoderma evansii]
MTLKDGTYIIASTLPSNPVLNIDGATTLFSNPIAGIVGFTKQTTNNQNQQWKVTALSPGVYGLKSALGPWMAAPDDGSVAQVDTSAYDPVPNLITRWRISDAGSGNYFIENVQYPGRVIDLEYASSADNTRAILYPYHQQANQIWQFIPVAI